MALSSIAKHLGSEFEQALRNATAQCVGLSPSELDPYWRQLETAVTPWLDQLASMTSLLNQRLAVLQELCKLFPERYLFQDPELSEAVLSSSGVASVGDRLPIGTVVRRSVSPRFGVLFQIRGLNGELFHHEFFE